MTAPAASAEAPQQQQQQQAPITRLPPYFPTSCKKCKVQTDDFFACFEAHAFMRDATDRQTAAESLSHCQPQLRAYMECMERHGPQAQRSRPWYKFW